MPVSHHQSRHLFREREKGRHVPCPFSLGNGKGEGGGREGEGGREGRWTGLGREGIGGRD